MFPLDNKTSFVYNPEITISKNELLGLLNEYYEKGKQDALKDIGVAQSNNVNTINYTDGTDYHYNN